MKPICYILIVLFLASCSKETTNRNPYLQEIGFSFDININLPLYNDLANTGNPVYISNAAVGLQGAFVINSGFNNFRVFEASCPNHAPSECAVMTINGLNALCKCDDYEYSLFTGQMTNRPDDGRTYYDMLEYRATSSGNSVVISN